MKRKRQPLDHDEVKRAAVGALASQSTLNKFLGLRSRPLARTRLPTPEYICDACGAKCDGYELLMCDECSRQVCSSCSVRFSGVRCLDH